MICDNCNIEFVVTRYNSKYCSLKCKNSANVKRFRENNAKICSCGKKISYNSTDCQTCSSKEKSINAYKEYIERWKNGLETGGSSDKVSKHVRHYLFEKYSSKCIKCGWCEINPTTGKIPLNVNHIDGNPLNHVESNLELICPNCHSLTSNFCGLNRGKGRPYRYKKK